MMWLFHLVSSILGETLCAVKLIIKLYLLVMQEFAIMKEQRIRHWEGYSNTVKMVYQDLASHIDLLFVCLFVWAFFLSFIRYHTTCSESLICCLGLQKLVSSVIQIMFESPLFSNAIKGGYNTLTRSIFLALLIHYSRFVKALQ